MSGAVELDLTPWESYDVDVQPDSLLHDPLNQNPARPKSDSIAPSDTLKKTVVSSQSSDPSSMEFAMLQGVVYSADDSKPIDNASVLLKKDSILLKAQSDAQGFFVLNKIPEGVYQVRITRKGYSILQKDNLKLVRGKKSVEDFLMDKRVAQGKLFEVQKPRSDAGADLMVKRQDGGVVMEGVSAEQIAKSTDSDAGAIAKRVTGTSVVGGKYVFVRGLGERYTNMTLNGLPVPTPEKDKRVVPQDLFPASALESFAIYKSFNADLPADFAGGSVALETKGFPERDFLKVSVGLGTGTSLGDDRLNFKTSSALADYMGYVSGSQEIPGGVPRTVSNVVQSSPDEIADIAQRWDSRWGLDTQTVWPNLNTSISAGKVYALNHQAQHGFLANFSFKNSYDSETLLRRKIIVESVRDSIWVERRGKLIRAYGLLNDTLDNGSVQPLRILKTGLEQDVETGEYATTLSGLLNWGYLDRNNALWVKTLYANLSEKKVTHNNSFSMPGISAGQENEREERFILDFERRAILVGQFGGSHYVGRSILDSMAWAASLASSTGRQPDTKKYFYIRRDDSTLQWDTKQPWATRQFQEFDEQLYALRGDFFLVVPPEISPKEVFRIQDSWLSYVSLPTLKTGVMASWRDRAFDMNTYSWVDNTYKPTGTNYDLVESVLNPDSVANRVRVNGSGFRSFLGDYDTYEASEGSVASYGMLEQKLRLFHIPFTFQAGGRVEAYALDFYAPFTSEITLRTPELQSDSAIRIQVNEWEFFPSLGVSIEPIPKTRLHLLYSGTLVRPEMRERTPTLFFDTNEEIEVEGNPDLRNTYVRNYDLRFEWFLPAQQLISASLFYKQFKDPIEPVIDGNLAPARKYFQNAPKAYARGIEFEIDASPGRWFDQTPKVLRHVGLYGNAAWIQSKVRIDTTAEGTSLLTSKSRPMIGQSPYVYNIKLTHEYKWESKQNLMNGLLFNVTGRRIRNLGVSYVPDTYEEPFASLDYLLKYDHGSHGVGFKLVNLLNAVQRYTVTEYNQDQTYQSIDDATRDRVYQENGVKTVHTISRKRPGISGSLSYQYAF